MQWSPHVKLRFSDEELIQNLVSTHDRPERRTGNWWTFFTRLCQHEQACLVAEAERRWSCTFVTSPIDPDESASHAETNAESVNAETIRVLSQVIWH